MSSNSLIVGPVEKVIVIVLLLFVSIFGTVGNGVVLWVYGRRQDHQTATFFINVLAAADLLVCVLVAPCALAMEWLEYVTNSWTLCRGFYFLNTCNAMFCSWLISAVALDRYLCICHPMKQILTVRRAQWLVAALALFACFMGVLSSVNVMLVPAATENSSSILLLPNATTNHICEELTYAKNATWQEQVFYEITQKANHCSFALCIVVVLACYYCVYRVVLKLRKRARSLTVSSAASVIQHHCPEPAGLEMMSPELPHEESPAEEADGLVAVQKNSDFHHDHNEDPPLKSSIRHASDLHRGGRHRHSHELPGVNGKLNRKPRLSFAYQPATTLVSPRNPPKSFSLAHFPSTSTSASPSMGLLTNIRRRSRMHFKRLLSDCRYAESLQNLRSAAMLFVVAVVYILVFTPAILMAANWVPMNVVVFNLYYLNNVSNPVIYCFMNKGFRDRLRRISWKTNYRHSIA